jgi:hypothetical protein
MKTLTSKLSPSRVACIVLLSLGALTQFGCSSTGHYPNGGGCWGCGNYYSYEHRDPDKHEHESKPQPHSVSRSIIDSAPRSSSNETKSHQSRDGERADSGGGHVGHRRE